MRRSFFIIRYIILVSLFISLAISCSEDDIDTDDNNVLVEPQFPCENGLANGHPCNGLDLMSQVPVEELGGPGAEGNDSWGWTDPITGNEYALVGTTTSAAFVDITNPSQPIYLGRIPTETV